MGHVATNQFDGPLDLLLSLVERGKIQVTELSISSLAHAYLEQIQALKDSGVEELSEFISLGSRLVCIKSQALLPASAQPAAAELSKLNLELADYRNTRAAAHLLASLPLTQTFERPIQAVPVAAPQIAGAHDHANRLPASVLQNAVHALIERTSTNWPTKLTPARPKLSLEAATRALAHKLQASPLSLRAILAEAHSRSEAIVWFLACLELARAGGLVLGAARTNDAADYTLEAVRV